MPKTLADLAQLLTGAYFTKRALEGQDTTAATLLIASALLALPTPKDPL